MSQTPVVPILDPHENERILRAEVAALKEQLRGLEKKQPRYRDMFDTKATQELSKGFFLATGSWDWDILENDVKWSDELFQILGYNSKTDMASVEAFLAAIHPEDRPALQAETEKAFREGQGNRTSARILWRDGRVRRIQMEGMALRNSEGKAIRMLGIVVDVTDYTDQADATWRTNQLLHEAQVLADVGSWIWNIEEGWMEMSEGAWRISGREAKPRVTLAESLAFIHPDDQELAKSAAQKAIREGSDLEVEIEYRVVRPSGEIRLVLHRSKTLGTNLENSRLRLGTVLDVTAMRHAEEAVRRSNQLLNEAQLLGQSGYWIWNLDTGSVEWSDSLCRITGMEPGAKTDIKEILNFIHPEDLNRVRASMLTAVEGAGPMAIEFRLRLANGSIRHILQRSRPFESSGLGAGRLRLGTMVDVSELRKAEAESVQAHHVAEVALNLAKAGSWVFYPSRKELNWSQGLYSIFGVKPGTVITREFFHSLVHPDDLKHVQSTEKASLEDMVGRWILFRIVRPDNGGVRHLEMQGSWVDQASSDGSIFIGISIDVTDRIRLEEAQRQKHKLEAIGRLAGGVAHDFNNLLTVILGHAEELNSQQPNERLNQILKAGHLSAALTQRLLAFSRQAVVRPQSMDLTQVVRGMASILDRLIGDDVQIVYDLNSTLSRISADTGQVEQVLLNLAINARDAMPSGGKISVATNMVDSLPKNIVPLATQAINESESCQHVLLAVEDSGTGMPPEVLNRLFEPFFTTKEIGKGTGLGLSTVLGILTEAGGRIAVNTKSGSGTRFEIYWPVEVADAKPKSPENPLSVGAAVQKGRVAVVEDNPQLRRLLVEILESGGYVVACFASAEEAANSTAKQIMELDCVVTDMVMPDMHGQVLAQNLRGKRPGLPVLFISGYPRLDLDQNLEGGFLQKPFTRSQLLNAVAELLLSENET